MSPNKQILSINSLWNTYKNSEDVNVLLSKILEDLSNYLNSDFGLLYLCDDKVLTAVKSSLEQDFPKPEFTTEFILSSLYGLSKNVECFERIPKDSLACIRRLGISNSASISKIEPSIISKDILPENDFEYVAIFSDKVIICEGLFIFKLKKDRIVDNSSIGNYLDQALPIIEAVYRRKIDRLTRKYFARLSATATYTDNPGFHFQNSFKDFCQVLMVQGASLLVKGFSSNNLLQLVATYPKILPKDRNIYPEGCFSPTQWIFNFGLSCFLPNINLIRTELLKIPICKIGSNPIWCDLAEEKERSVLFLFYETPEGSLYLLRCTNSEKNPTKLFNYFDRKFAQEMLISLAMLHRSLENEFRSMKIFIDIKHEFRQKLTGIKSATNFVTSLIIEPRRFGNVKNEGLHKLEHIGNTVSDIVKMLDRFKFPLPALELTNYEVTPFNPYSELVRPICESFSAKAYKNGKKFSYYNIYQLGKVYSKIEEWRQVIENVVSNMVKYTYDNEKMQVAFQRMPEGHGAIHFASRSIPIDPSEKERIFDIKYRTIAAQKHTDEGEGMGLAICKSILARYDGSIAYKTENDINVFTIIIPRHLFRPQDNKI